MFKFGGEGKMSLIFENFLALLVFIFESLSPKHS